MNGHLIRIGLLLLLLTGCSELQVKRDIQHANDVARYRQAITAAAPSLTAANCVAAPALGTWRDLTFAPDSKILKLPNDLAAAAICVSVPTNAKVLRIQSFSAGGMSYFQLTLVNPSVLFLDKDMKVLSDVQKGSLSPGEDFFRGLRISGNIVLNQSLSGADYAVFYVHPLSLDHYISVQTGSDAVPVPFAPYGQIEVRFE